ncbi:RNA polymerase sigma factor CnrH [Anaerohalosphaera lusitana]|uniref:RNA polymerase sigma factor CnrH n=1 Tax=Anaerohalosphaera lusitana TaxID=1936003 RepID=A0A1U9NJH6_9BACT|nr:sigma-70 family RNA polymerase sigma factor [Anaerohalosphaera lusitana]AQT67884.1 RNA polymerase sigma factor CnrH [Anaerohalosphaera lusitana]
MSHIDAHKNGEVDKGKRFVRLLMASEGRIYSYILTLVGNWSDAEDIMQDTAEVMWCKYDQSEPIENFTAWGISIARNKVLNYYRKKGNYRVLFNSDVFDSVAEDSARASSDIDFRVEALRNCLGRLGERDLRLIELRYEKGNTVKRIASYVGRPVQGLYKTMGRIHENLLECIRRALAREDMA